MGSPRVHAGAKVVLLLVQIPDGGSRYNIVDRQRGTPLVWLAVLAAAAIIAFARWRGLAAIAGLGVSFAVLLLFILPAVTAGEPPLPVAIVGAATIMFVVLYLTHGISVQTSIAVLGTLVSLVLTGVLAQVAADETTLAIYFKDVDVYGLLLAGIIIGSLGVLDDVTVTQAVTVTELVEADPGMSRRRLYRAASRVGRAHIASVVNTIVLAYAGASLPALLMIAAAGNGVGNTLTNQFVAQELVRSLVSTLGLVAAVPITTGLATLVATYGRSGPKQEQAPADEPASRPPAPKVPPVVPPRQADDDPWAEPATGWLDDAHRT